MCLHFKDGNEYDYPTYNGSNKITLDSLQKSPYRPTFLYLSGRIPEGEADRYLFANFRYKNTIPANINSQLGTENYIKWASRYGTKEKFTQTISDAFTRYCRLNPTIRGWDIDLDVVLGILSDIQIDEDYVELLIELVWTTPDLRKALEQELDHNAILSLQYERVKKIARFYDWFCLL